MSPVVSPVLGPVVSPTPAVVVLGTESGVHSPGYPVALAGRTVTALAPRHGGGWLALVEGREVWSGAPGTGWELMATLPAGVDCTCLADTGPARGVIAGVAGAHLWWVDGGQDVRFEDAPGRAGWYTPWGGPPDTRSISVGPDGSHWVNVHVGGILRSSEGGAWQATIDVDSDVHQVHALGDGRVLAACARGLAESGDGGLTWEYAASGLDGRYSRAVAVAGTTVVVSASTGPRTGRAGIYHRPLDQPGARFGRSTAGLPASGWFPFNIDTGQLAAADSNVVLGTEAGEAYLSVDGAHSWESVARGLPPVTAVAVAVAAAVG